MEGEKKNRCGADSNPHGLGGRERASELNMAPRHARAFIVNFKFPFPSPWTARRVHVTDSKESEYKHKSNADETE